MDVDPLADRPPPRHALESDSEDEPDAGLYTSNRTAEKRQPEAEKPTAIVWTKTSYKNKTPDKLIIALEQVSAALIETFDFEVWEEIAKVHHGDEEIGQVLHHGKITLIQLRDSHQIGIYSSRNFAQKILEEFPSKEIVILDTYPLPAYISTTRTQAQDSTKALSPPIRFLSTLLSLPPPGPAALSHSLAPFSPPNLLTSPTASLLSLAVHQSRPNPENTDRNRNMTALLLPALHTSPVFGPNTEEEWETNTLRSVMDYAVGLVGSSGEELDLRLKEPDRRKKVGGRKNARYGESGMYI